MPSTGLPWCKFVCRGVRKKGHPRSGGEQQPFWGNQFLYFFFEAPCMTIGSGKHLVKYFMTYWCGDEAASLVGGRSK